jgi:hypothetical protein
MVCDNRGFPSHIPLIGLGMKIGKRKNAVETGWGL